MQLENDGTTTSPDHQDDRDVANERTPIVRRLDNSDVEAPFPEHSADGEDIAETLSERLEDGFPCTAPSPRVGFDLTTERAESCDEKRGVLRYRASRTRG